MNLTDSTAAQVRAAPVYAHLSVGLRALADALQDAPGWLIQHRGQA